MPSADRDAFKTAKRREMLSRVDIPRAEYPDGADRSRQATARSLPRHRAGRMSRSGEELRFNR